MAVLVWDKIDARHYEAGVDRGVFYPLLGTGVPWNGLLAVEEGFVGGETSSSYVDGVKQATLVGSRNYQAIVRALSAPREFVECGGQRAAIPGFFLANQPKLRFNFSYRTGLDDGYKLHLVYNVLASPTKIGYQTMGNSPAPSTLEWKFDATPVAVPGFRATSHFVVDSTRTPPQMLTDLEERLYGSAIFPPSYPSPAELRAIFGGLS